tara:strand:+ start:75 stop:635 length:561 start_codon:yes stop_codon:yes gene_type:complete
MSLGGRKRRPPMRGGRVIKGEMQPRPHVTNVCWCDARAYPLLADGSTPIGHAPSQGGAQFNLEGLFGINPDPTGNGAYAYYTGSPSDNGAPFMNMCTTNNMRFVSTVYPDEYEVFNNQGHSMWFPWDGDHPNSWQASGCVNFCHKWFYNNNFEDRVIMEDGWETWIPPHFIALCQGVTPHNQGVLR